MTQWRIFDAYLAQHFRRVFTFIGRYRKTASVLYVLFARPRLHSGRNLSYPPRTRRNFSSVFHCKPRIAAANRIDDDNLIRRPPKRIDLPAK
jgi:hypothetical protein